MVLAAFAHVDSLPAALTQWGLHYQVSKLAIGTAAPAADLVTSTVVVNQKGNAGVYGGRAVISLALSVVNDRWSPIGQSVTSLVNSLEGQQVYEAHKPAVIVPPGGLYSLHSVASATTVDTVLGNIWAEVDASEIRELGLA